MWILKVIPTNVVFESQGEFARCFRAEVCYYSESPTPKAIGSYLLPHTSYRAYFNYTRRFDLYLS